MSASSLEIEVDRETCRGSQTCVRRAPGTFSLDEEGKARVADAPAEAEDVIIAAANACPTFSIHVRRDGRELC